MQPNENDRRQSVRRREDLEGRLNDLEIVLGGDMVTQKKGIVQIVQDIATDMYGQPRGLSGRVALLEEFKLRGEERAKGAMWMARLVWGLFCGTLGGALGFVIRAYVK